MKMMLINQDCQYGLVSMGGGLMHHYKPVLIMSVSLAQSFYCNWGEIRVRGLKTAAYS